MTRRGGHRQEPIPEGKDYILDSCLYIPILWPVSRLGFSYMVFLFPFSSFFPMRIYSSPFPLDAEGFAWLDGDNPLLSEDSSIWGPVPLALIEGRITFIVWPFSRTGSLRSFPPPTSSPSGSRRQPSGSSASTRTSAILKKD